MLNMVGSDLMQLTFLKHPEDINRLREPKEEKSSETWWKVHVQYSYPTIVLYSEICTLFDIYVVSLIIVPFTIVFFVQNIEKQYRSSI